jgi:hypothetical protein
MLAAESHDIIRRTLGAARPLLPGHAEQICGGAEARKL